MNNFQKKSLTFFFTQTFLLFKIAALCVGLAGIFLFYHFFYKTIVLDIPEEKKPTASTAPSIQIETYGDITDFQKNKEKSAESFDERTIQASFSD